MKPLKTLIVGSMLMVTLAASAFAASAGGGTVNATALNLRSEPSTSAQVQGVLSKDSAVIVTEETSSEWLKVQYGGIYGYVANQYISRSTAIDADFGNGIINGDYIRLRSEPGTDADIIELYNKGTAVLVTGVNGEWYKVSCNGQAGYIYSEYISFETVSVSSSSSEGQAIVDTGMQYLGVHYVYGGASPSGFDCSGFVYYVYKQNGYTINRTAASQLNNGVEIDKNGLQAGDIVVFNNGSGGSIGHSGIYIGDNKFIHSSSGAGSVVISSLSDNYYATYYYGARRVV